MSLLRNAYRMLRGRGLRFVLTGSGMVWGVFVFVVLSALGVALERFASAQMDDTFGLIVAAVPGVVLDGSSVGTGRPRRIELEAGDAKRLRRSHWVERAAPHLDLGWRAIKTSSRQVEARVIGTVPAAAGMRHWRTAAGRFIRPGDIETRSRIAVIGGALKRQVFGRRPAVGERLRIDGTSFTVVGVTEPKAENLISQDIREDELVMVPITTAQVAFTASKAITLVWYEPPGQELLARSKSRVLELVGPHHDFDPEQDQAIGFVSPWEMAGPVRNLVATMRIFLAACGFLTMASAGLGVMGVALVVVAERTREISLRRAIGATQRDIGRQVLGETLVVALGAGGLGWCLGLWAVAALRTSESLADVDAARVIVERLPFDPLFGLISLGLLLVVALAASFVPALRAMRLDPADGLRKA